MKVTVFTSNQARHIGLVRRLAAHFDQVNAIIEARTVVPGKVRDLHSASETMQRYFQRVLETEHLVFEPYASIPENVKSLVIRAGDLNVLPLSALEPMLDTDAIVVFGAGYIKPPLIDILVAKNAINLHLGVSPYYRGSACNFWASQQGNFHLVGATIHQLSKGLDSGGIYCHVLPPTTGDVFELGMRSVESAHTAYVDLLQANRFQEWEPVPQNPDHEICYSRSKDFTDAVASDYLDNLPTHDVVLDQLNAYRQPDRYVRLWNERSAPEDV